MTKKEFIDAVASKTGFSKKDTGVTVEALLETVKEALQDGETIKLASFGTFTVVEKGEREGRNPSTGETIVIPAGKTPKFKFSKVVKDFVK